MQMSAHVTPTAPQDALAATTGVALIPVTPQKPTLRRSRFAVIIYIIYKISKLYKIFSVWTNTNETFNSALPIVLPTSLASMIAQMTIPPTRLELTILHFTKFYSHAGGMAVAQPYSFKIDFVRNRISGSAARYFVMILKFILTPIFEIKSHEKNSLKPKKIIFEAQFSGTNFHLPISKFVILQRLNVRVTINALRVAHVMDAMIVGLVSAFATIWNKKLIT